MVYNSVRRIGSGMKTMEKKMLTFYNFILGGVAFFVRLGMLELSFCGRNNWAQSFFRIRKSVAQSRIYLRMLWSSVPLKLGNTNEDKLSLSSLRSIELHHKHNVHMCCTCIAQEWTENSIDKVQHTTRKPKKLVIDWREVVVGKQNVIDPDFPLVNVISTFLLLTSFNTLGKFKHQTNWYWMCLTKRKSF